jgi:hypothetical protein
VECQDRSPAAEQTGELDRQKPPRFTHEVDNIRPDLVDKVADAAVEPGEPMPGCPRKWRETYKPVLAFSVIAMGIATIHGWTTHRQINVVR